MAEAKAFAKKWAFILLLVINFFSAYLLYLSFRIIEGFQTQLNPYVIWGVIALLMFIVLGGVWKLYRIQMHNSSRHE